MLLLAPQRRHRFDRQFNHLRQQQRFALELDAPHRDARDVEQVVDDAGELNRLAAHDLGRALRRLVITDEPRNQLGGITNGRQRIAQLVSQHGEEFVFAAIRVPQGRVRERSLGHVNAFDEKSR